MKNADAIRAGIRRHLTENLLFTNSLELKDDQSFLDEGVVDSTGVMDLVLFVEETFDLTVEDEEITPDNFDSIGRLAAYIERKLDTSQS